MLLYANDNLFLHSAKVLGMSGTLNLRSFWLSSPLTGRLLQQKGRMMTRANSAARTSQEPLKRELTKAGAETRTAPDAALLAGAAGQITNHLFPSGLNDS